MTTLVLTNELVYKSFMIGAKNVISEKNNLNAINVFPVPDGDTGTNLASMMRSILERSKLGDTTSETIQSIADAAIVGARGNSGIIFAEYIHGFSEDLVSDIDQETFVLRSEKAFTYAYSAIAKPVEGTMITVMRTWAEALKSFKQASSNFLDLMMKAYELAKEELLKTPEKLQVLKDNKVVDAGAKGFVHFIEGFIKALRGEDVEIDHQIDAIEELHVDHLEDATFRYCTEALITSKNIDLNDLRKNLAQFGDSLVVAGTKTTARIHIHSDRPDEVFAYLDGLSQIKEQKVDDMKRQFEAANHRKYDIALVTDSIADLPESVIDQYQIHQYPLNIHLNDTNYYDKVTMQSRRFYELMDSLETYPTSSQPNQKSLENFFSFLTTYYKKIIVLTVSSKMSGTYQVFEETAKRFKDANIKVIDSRQNSGAEGLLVYQAAKMIDEGLSFEDVVEKIEALREKSKILVSVQTLKYMVRSGRVSKVTGVIGKILNLKPVISIDETGQGIIFDKGLSIKSSNNKIFKHMTEIKNTYGVENYAIVHANAKDRAESYEKVYTELLGKKPLYIMDISTIVAMSAGIGTVAIAYIRGDKS